MENEKPKSIWTRPWRGRPQMLVIWLLLSLAIALVIVIGSMATDNSPAETSDYLLAIVISLIASGILLGVLGFLRWLLHWRNFKRFLFAVACFVTVIALLITEENWRGRRAWENFKHEWEVKGEKFKVADFAPAPVPDEHNFAMTPLLKPAMDFMHTSNGIQWRDTNAYARLQNLRADISPGRETNNKLELGNLERGTLADLEACRNFYRGNKNYPQPVKTGTAAEDILVALGKFSGELEELNQAAVTRPYSRFPIEYDSEPAAEILLPHLAQIKGIGMMVNLHAVALLDAGRSEEAFEDLKLGFRLSDSIKNEPILIDHLVRIATLSFELQAIREGLARHAWKDDQLREIEKYLQSLDLLAELKDAMRGERALCIDSLDYLRRMGSVNWDFWAGGTVPSRKGLSFLLSSFFYRNMLTVSEMHQKFTIPSIDEKAHRVFPEMSKALDQEIEVLHQQRYNPYKFLAAILFPSLSSANAKSARIQIYVDEARVACALERYRRANGQFPESLAALVPRFIESVPTDVIDGNPLRYRQTPDGSYLLYSIGWNKTDDGGVLAWTKGKTPDLDSKGVDSKEGDWVWRYPTK